MSAERKRFGITFPDYDEARSQDRNLEAGRRVVVFWGWGRGFRAHGTGEVVKVNRMSVQVALSEDVPSPYGWGGAGWKAGTVLKGIPRVDSPSWRMGANCVVEVNS